MSCTVSCTENDNKDFFHFHPAIFERYPDFLASHPVVTDFVNQAKKIWALVYTTVYEIFNKIEVHYPKVVDKIYATQTPRIVLRFLKYEWQNSGKYLAKPHFDAGSFTLAIAESCPGLRIGRGSDSLKLIDPKDDQAIFMISSNFKKVINTDELLPGWHDVIQVNESLIGQPFARWAIVAFIEAHGVEALPRTETHKWFEGIS